jgi:hypothetical protein
MKTENILNGFNKQNRRILIGVLVFLIVMMAPVYACTCSLNVCSSANFIVHKTTSDGGQTIDEGTVNTVCDLFQTAYDDITGNYDYASPTPPADTIVDVWFDPQQNNDCGGVTETIVDSGGQIQIKVGTDYAGCFSSEMELRDVIATHETLHYIQRSGYNILWDNRPDVEWWMEATAVWMEDTTLHNGVDNYWQYLGEDVRDSNKNLCRKDWDSIQNLVIF